MSQFGLDDRKFARSFLCYAKCVQTTRGDLKRKDDCSRQNRERHQDFQERKSVMVARIHCAAPSSIIMAPVNQFSFKDTTLLPLAKITLPPVDPPSGKKRITVELDISLSLAVLKVAATSLGKSTSTFPSESLNCLAFKSKLKSCGRLCVKAKYFSLSIIAKIIWATAYRRSRPPDSFV